MGNVPDDRRKHIYGSEAPKSAAACLRTGRRFGSSRERDGLLHSQTTGCELRRLKRRAASRNMVDKAYNVLFLCTGNSARSILAESVLNRLGTGSFRGLQCGQLSERRSASVRARTSGAAELSDETPSFEELG